MPDDTRTAASKGVGAKPWIKMRTDLWDDPRISALCDALEADEARVIGGLYRLWSIADAHSTDGRLSGMTKPSVDRKCGIPGFAESLESVGWLSADDASVTIPDFTIHNGQSAKSRAQAAVRQQARRSKQQASAKPSRSQRDAVVTNSKPKRNASVTREDKRQNKQEPPPPATAESQTPCSVAHEWTAAEGVLVETGLADATGTARIARDRGYSPEQVLELVAEFNRRRGEFASEGALAWRIANSPPTRPLAEGWPGQTSNKSPGIQQDREAELLRQRCKADLDRMAIHDVIALAERAGVENARTRLSERGKAVLRPDELTRVLNELARAESKPSADRDGRSFAENVAASVPQNDRKPHEVRTEAV